MLTSYFCELSVKDKAKRMKLKEELVQASAPARAAWLSQDELTAAMALQLEVWDRLAT